MLIRWMTSIVHADGHGLTPFVPFAPSEGPSGEGLPVVLFIHGESYEWGAGGAYDGSVLAALGRLIFVAVDFRLGRLGECTPASLPSLAHSD